MILFSILILLGYCIFFIWLTEGLRKSDYKINTFTDNILNVSIIISARNEEKNIENLLESLKQLSYPSESYEIIIVNDRSSDNTMKMLNIAKKDISLLKIVNIKETPIGWAPKKWALQQAIKESKNEIILQTDADCTFHKNWIETMVNSFNNKTIGFIAGPAPIRYKNNFFDQFSVMDSLAIDAISASTIKSKIPLSCNGRNICFRKSAFLDIDGYEGIEDQISGDDDLLMHKMALSKNWEIDYICQKEAVVNSVGPDTIKELIFQRLRFASKTLSYYNLKINTSTKTILPYLYCANFIIVMSISTFLSTLNIIWLIPFMIKLLSDCLLTITFFYKIKIKWSLFAFVILNLIHPFYVIIFATIAPFHKIKWKN